MIVGEAGVSAPWGAPCPAVGVAGEPSSFFASSDAESLTRRLVIATEMGRLGVWEADPELRWARWNDRMLEMFGLNPAEFTGRVPELMRHVEPEDAARTRRELLEHVERRQPYRTTYRIVRPDGERRLIESTAGFDEDEDGRVIRIFGISRDVTEAGSHEADLLAARDKAESASRAKSAFLAHMSHELRTPLNAIIGFAEFLTIEEIERNPADIRRYVGIIRKAGEHLLSLINDILDFSAIESRQLRLRPRPLATLSALAEALRLLHERAQSRQLALTMDASQRLPKVMADERAFRQILLNLVGNAIKYTPEGGRITLSAAERGGRLELRIADNGPGFPAEALNRGFEPFVAPDNPLTASQQGSGLGLAIVRGLVQAMAGEIVLANGADGGAEVTLRLPLASGDEVAPEA